MTLKHCANVTKLQLFLMKIASQVLLMLNHLRKYSFYLLREFYNHVKNVPQTLLALREVQMTNPIHL